MSGVTWRALPLDAPEPPPLSLVRNDGGHMWLHMPDGAALGWSGLTGKITGLRFAWTGVMRDADAVELAERGDQVSALLEALPALPPLRTDALTAAVELVKQLRVPTISEVERVLRAVHPFTVTADEDGA